MMGRQINGTSDGTSPSIWKQGSLNLPTPEESGFPAHHPDMCILRIRRNHLLEVGGWVRARGGVGAAVAGVLGLAGFLWEVCMCVCAADICSCASCAHCCIIPASSPCSAIALPSY
jgi:hypothetical protein